MSTMPHTITLSPEVSQKLEVMMAEGHFSSPADTVEYYLEIAYLETTSLTQYSASALQHVDEAAAQAQRGEVVSHHEVEAFFEDWRKELAK